MELEQIEEYEESCKDFVKSIEREFKLCKVAADRDKEGHLGTV